MGSLTASLLAARRCKRLVRQWGARSDRPDAAGAEPLLRQALAEAKRSHRPKAILRAAHPLYALLRWQRRLPESVVALECVVDAHRRLDGLDGRWTREWRNELIGLYGSLGRCGELETVCRERLESDARRCGEGSAEASWALLTLAWALRRSGRCDESEPLCRRALTQIEAIYGAGHPRTGWALVGLAQVRGRQDDLQEAESLLRQARANWERSGFAGRAAAVDDLLRAVGKDDETAGCRLTGPVFPSPLL